MRIGEFKSFSIEKVMNRNCCDEDFNHKAHRLAKKARGDGRLGYKTGQSVYQKHGLSR